tara:strand:- start:44 stop:451 length:408 start_codon:yes stop_codon:yes gene_type:complete
MKKILLSLVLVFLFSNSLYAEQFNCIIKQHYNDKGDVSNEYNENKWGNGPETEYLFEINGNNATIAYPIMNMPFFMNFRVFNEHPRFIVGVGFDESIKSNFTMNYFTFNRKSLYLIVSSHMELGISINQGTCKKV